MEQRKDSWIVVICAITLLVHYYIATESKISGLKATIEFSDKALEIESENVRDLIYANNQLKIESEGKSSATYVAGVVSALNEPDEFSKIWHDGYDRGTETQILANKVQEEGQAKLGL